MPDCSPRKSRTGSADSRLIFLLGTLDSKRKSMSVSTNGSERSALTLINASQIESEELTGLSDFEVNACKTILRWAQEFLCKPNPQLGREGPVCPFTQPSLHHRLFWLTVRRGSSIDLEESSQVVDAYRELFLELEPRTESDSLLKTILIVFPEVSAVTARTELEALQKKLKPDFVKRGLMLGQFYEGCPEPGLWNDSFHPLQSPLPLLAIRNMVPSDFPFLHGKRGNADMLIAYLNRFGKNIPREVKQLMVEALESSDLTLQPKESTNRER